MTNHKVIYDTDPGVDDAMALMQALHPEIELLGVTSMFGNATIETTTANAPYLRSRFAPGVPVARGAAAPLHRAPPAPVGWIHGDNGLGNIELSEPADTTLDARLAHQFMIDTVRAHLGEVTLIAVGPLTNLAHALKADPDIVGLVKQVVIMGGAFGIASVLGNVSPDAEANIMCDPEADLVLGAAWPVTPVGLDVTQSTIMPNEWLAPVCARARPAVLCGTYHGITRSSTVTAPDSKASMSTMRQRWRTCWLRISIPYAKGPCVC